MENVGHPFIVIAPRSTSIQSEAMDGKSYRQEWATAETPNEPAVSGVRITPSGVCPLNLTTIACGTWSLVAN